MIDTLGKVFEKCACRWIIREVADRADAAERPRHIRRAPDIVRENLRRHRIEPAQRNHQRGERRARPRAIRILLGSCRVIERLPLAAKRKVPALFIGGRRDTRVSLCLLFDQLAVT